MNSRVVVACDGSPASEAALIWAKDFAGVANGAVILLRVLPTVPSPVPESTVDAYPSAENVAFARADLAKTAERFGLDAQTAVATGTHVGDCIVAWSREHGAGMIVMGTRGNGGITRVLLGSVADHVARHAHCPVVTLAPAAARALSEPHAA